MNESKVETSKVSEQVKTDKVMPKEKFDWETPKIEDVSDEVMAQPYIRFT